MTSSPSCPILLVLLSTGGLCWAQSDLTSKVQNSANPVAPPSTAAAPEQLPQFGQLDKDRDGVIKREELTAEDQARFGSIWDADLDSDNVLTRDEFNTLTETSFTSMEAIAALVLLGAFAGFCLCIDGVLEPERRDFFWVAILATVGLLGLGYVVASGWYLDGSPYLGWVAVVPLLFMALAFVTGNTREIEIDTVDQDEKKVYVVGSGGKSEGVRTVGAGGTRSSTGTRRPATRSGSLAPGRTARRPPGARPPTPPPRRPPGRQPPPGKRPPKPPGGAGPRDQGPKGPKKK